MNEHISEIHKLKKELEEAREQIERLKSLLVSYEYQDKIEIKGIIK